MDDTYTLNDGTADRVYSGKSRTNGSSAIWFAPSARADLAGRPSLTVTNDVTNAGIARATITFRDPVYNEDKGAYDAFERVNIVATQPTKNPILSREKLLRRAASLLTQAADDISTGNV